MYIAEYSELPVSSLLMMAGCRCRRNHFHWGGISLGLYIFSFIASGCAVIYFLNNSGFPSTMSTSTPHSHWFSLPYPAKRYRMSGCSSTSSLALTLIRLPILNSPFCQLPSFASRCFIISAVETFLLVWSLAVHLSSSPAPASAAGLVTGTKFAQRTGRGSRDLDSELARVRMKG